MALLSFLFWLEVLLLFSAGVCYVSGRWTSRERPNDLYRTFQAFWQVMLSRQVARYEVPDVARHWREVQMAVEGLDAVGETSDLDALLTGPEVGEPALPGAANEPGPARQIPGSAPSAPPVPGAAPVTTEEVSLTVRVMPQPGPPRILRRNREVLEVQLPAAPEQGESNRALIELLAERIHIRIYQIHLISGHYRELKSLRIAGLSRAELNQRLLSAAGSGSTL